jgi:hypothetical protein
MRGALTDFAAAFTLLKGLSGLGSHIILDPVPVSPASLMTECSPTSNIASIQNLTMGSKLNVQIKIRQLQVRRLTLLTHCLFDCTLGLKVRPSTYGL